VNVAFLHAFPFFNPLSDPCDRLGIRRQLTPLRRNSVEFSTKVWRGPLGSCLPFLCHKAIFARLQCKRAPVGLFDPPRFMHRLQIFAASAGQSFATQIASPHFEHRRRSDDTFGFGISATRKQTTHTLSSMASDIALRLRRLFCVDVSTARSEDASCSNYRNKSYQCVWFRICRTREWRSASYPS
jgi:hypothetical protein